MLNQRVELHVQTVYTDGVSVITPREAVAAAGLVWMGRPFVSWSRSVYPGGMWILCRG